VELEARLIDDLLDLTRIVRGKLALNLEDADVHALVDAVAGMYRSDIDGKCILLSMRLDAQWHYVHGDPGRLQQIFWNILKNATKFTGPGGSI
jgi:signal transduction histidine kinase